MRDQFDRFTEAGAQVVTVAPDTRDGVAKFVRNSDYPFPLLADEDHEVFDAYDVVSKLASLGQRPATFVLDAEGVVRFDAIGTQQWQIPSIDEVLTLVSG